MTDLPSLKDLDDGVKRFAMLDKTPPFIRPSIYLNQNPLSSCIPGNVLEVENII